MILVLRQQFAEALAHLDRAFELQPDMPGAVLLHATCYNGLGRYEEALVQGRRYLDLLGADDTGYFNVGISLANLDRTDEAIAAFRLGLDDYSDSVENLIALAQVLPPRVSVKRPTASRPSSQPDISLRGNCRAAADARAFPPRCSPSSSGIGPSPPTTPATTTSPAKRTFSRTSIKRRPILSAGQSSVPTTGSGPGYVRALIGTLLSANQPRAAYEAAPNPTGFHQVANYLIENDRVDDAEEIFKLHEQQFADDPWLAYFAPRRSSFAASSPKPP